jgi:molybdopterin synthase catalytic subunit
MIEITSSPIIPDILINKVKNNRSGCVTTYVGLIRDNSHDKPVLSIEYQDTGNAAKTLQDIADEARQKWQIENIGIVHRTGKLRVGDINLVVAVAAAHRDEGFSACQYAIDQFKERLPTRKIETYHDGSTLLSEPEV